MISNGHLTMMAYARFNEFLTVGYFLNGLSILGVNFENFKCHLGATYVDGMTGDPPPPPFLFWIFKGYLPMIAFPKFNEFLTMAYFLNTLPMF